jgi:hypothetical protein
MGARNVGQNNHWFALGYRHSYAKIFKEES